MNKINGFTMVEALTGMSIISFIVLLTLPLHHLLQLEREVLFDRRTFTYYLHDELLEETNRTNVELKDPFHIMMNDKDVYVSFENDDFYIKGCVTWTNAKKTEETQCLYGIEKQ